MRREYRDWIAMNVDGDGYGQCAEVTARMAADFPELIRIRGHYLCYVWGERGHWWLVDQHGEIVDPTAGQFPSQGQGTYVPWPEGAPEPTGICANCGGACYNGDTCCSETCGREYAAFCLNP